MFNVQLRMGRAALLRRFDYIMDAVALLSPLVLLPQVLSIYATQNVAGLSLITWILFSGLNALWIIYGVARKSTPILIANLLSGVLNVTGAIGIILFR
jgi:uncharacterized protein with PQ loop repeat